MTHNTRWTVIYSPCDECGLPLWPIGSSLGVTSVSCTLQKGHFDDGMKFMHATLGVLEVVTKLVNDSPQQILFSEEDGLYYRLSDGKRVAPLGRSVVKEMDDNDGICDDNDARDYIEEPETSVP